MFTERVWSPCKNKQNVSECAYNMLTKSFVYHLIISYIAYSLAAAQAAVEE